MHAFEAEPVHQPDGVVRHLVDRIVDPGIGALAAAAMIVDDVPVGIRECGYLPIPYRAAAAETGHEHYRIALSGFFVINFGIADIDFGHGWSFLRLVTLVG